MTDTVAQEAETQDDLRAGSQKRELMGHPIGIWVCFLTEMWERFSYYGMRALLILYLTQHFKFTGAEAGFIYGAYTGLVYLLPILGGFLADRYLGSRKSVTFGAILLVLGHISMAFEGPSATVVDGEVVRNAFYADILFLSLALIITGVGFLKANISTIVGALYGEKDPRRDAGFSIFYMGINLGSLMATFIVGYIGEVYGWGYGFGLAGIGMVLGLAVFLYGQSLLDGRADPPEPARLKEKTLFGLVNKEQAIYLFGFVLIGISWLMLKNDKVVGMILAGSGIVMVAGNLFYAYTKCTKTEFERLIVANILIAMQAVFWALFEQQGASLTLLANEQFNLDIGVMTLKASQVQTMNPLFIVMFAPVFAWMWIAMAKKGYEPSTPIKFAIGLLLVGLGYIVMAYGLGADAGSNKSFIWLFLIYLFMTWGELCLSPVGLSMVTKLSPARIVGFMMGTWFLFSAMGNYVAGWISSLTGSGGHGAEGAGIIDLAATIEVYNLVGLMAAGIGVLLIIITPLLKRGMHGVH